MNGFSLSPRGVASGLPREHSQKLRGLGDCVSRESAHPSHDERRLTTARAAHLRDPQPARRIEAL